MAKNTSETEAQSAPSGRYIKHGTLAGPQTVRMTHAPVPATGQYGAGKYDLAFTIEGQPCRLSVSAKNPQWAALIEAFGEPGAAWVGATVMVSDSKGFKAVNVVPIADAKGNAVA